MAAEMELFEKYLLLYLMQKQLTFKDTFFAIRFVGLSTSILYFTYILLFEYLSPKDSLVY